jgi:hypothetical protein
MALSPNFASDGTLLLGMFPNGVLRSRDFGGSFEMVWDGPGSVYSLELSPRFPFDGTIFFGVDDAIYRSTDAGTSWNRVWAEDVGRILLAVSPAYADDGTIFAGTRSGLFWSRDYGTSWSQVSLPGENQQVAGLAVSPEFATDGRVFAQVRGEDLLVGTLTEKAFRWDVASMPEPGYEITPIVSREGFDLIAFSPSYAADKTVFAAAMQSVLKSVDGGLSWELLPAYPLRVEAELAFAPWFVAQISADGDWHRFEPWSRDRPLEVSVGTLRSDDPSASITFEFVGRGVTWIGGKGPDYGIASVYLDGDFQDAIDVFAAVAEYQAQLFASPKLTLGHHVLTIRVDGVMNKKSSGTWIDVDAFDVTH